MREVTMSFLDPESVVGCDDETWCRWTGKLGVCGVKRDGPKTVYCCPQCGEVVLEEECFLEGLGAVDRIHIN